MKVNVRNTEIFYFLNKNAFLRKEVLLNKYFVGLPKENILYILNEIGFEILKIIQEKPRTLKEIHKLTNLDTMYLSKFFEKLLTYGVVKKLDKNSKNKVQLYNTYRYDKFEILYADKINNYKNSNLKFFVFPLHVYVYVTLRCNLNCIHCQVNASHNKKVPELKADEWVSFLSDIDRYGIFSITITGGEPFVRDDTVEILKKLGRLRSRIIVSTNGTLLNEKILNELKTSNIIFVVSVDGANDKTHDKFRGSRGSFIKVINTLKLFRKLGIEHHIVTTIHKENIDELEDIVKIALNAKARSINFNIIRPFGRATSNLGRKLFIEKNNLLKLRLIFKLLQEKYSQKIVINPPSLIKLLENKEFHLRTHKKNFDLKKQVKCTAGTSTLHIYPNGDVYPCFLVFGYNEFNMGNIKEKNLADIWLDKKWSILRGNILIKNLHKCKKCELISICNAFRCRLGAYTYTGDILSTPPHCLKDMLI